MANALRDESLSRRLYAEAEALRERFEKEFWLSDLGLYALALDGNKKPVRARSSNAGHVLSSGIASSDRAARITEQLTSSNFFSGWGVRTIATSEARYNPMSYHNGSVWPHDNSMIAAGFARYGYGEKAGLIFDSLFDAAIEMDQGRLPELFCGFRRRPGRAPILYPVACAPQAWASGALLHILSSLLGLEIDAASRTVKLSAPRLPSRVEEISVANLRVGEGSVDFVVKAKRGEVTVDVLAERGQARLVRV
jgi:glycogen debranching enzyme